MSDMATYKLVVLVDHSLDMSAGKVAAQAVHASLGVLRKCTNTKWASTWKHQGEPVIVLATKHAEEDFASVIKAAEHLKIPFAEVKDAGHTCVLPGTRTCIGIGPAPSVMINTFTNMFSLLG